MPTKVRFWASTLHPASSLKYALSPSSISPSTMAANEACTEAFPFTCKESTKKSSCRTEGFNSSSFGAISVVKVPPKSLRSSPRFSSSAAADVGTTKVGLLAAVAVAAPSPSPSASSAPVPSSLCSASASSAMCSSARPNAGVDWTAAAVVVAAGVAGGAAGVVSPMARSIWSISRLKNSSASICCWTLTGRPSQSRNEEQKPVGK
mmetsp:Transcript_108732/g.347017  ORF Transcript_108732/g.347017 Transcript_108732/m.347017 type:complete len:206 (+) Transcript_108732:2755-3372(+)